MDIEYTIVKKIIHTKVHYLSKINNIEDINSRLINFCKKLLLKENLNIEFLNTALIAENNLNAICDMNIKEDDTEFFIDAIYELFKINERDIYYYLLYKCDDYKEFHEFSDIIIDLNNKILPEYVLDKIYNLQKNIRNLKLNIKRSVYINPEHESFWKSNIIDNSKRLYKIKNINNKTEDFVEINNNIRNFNQSLNIKISNELKNYNSEFIKKIEEEFNIDDEYNCYSISNQGFVKILNHLKINNKKIIDYNISDKIDNDTISTILSLFPEIVLDFSLMETRPFFKNHYRKNNKEHKFIGKLKINKVILRVHEKAHFTNEEESLLYKLLDKLSVDKKLYNRENKILKL